MAHKFISKEAVDGHHLRSITSIHRCIINYSLLHYSGKSGKAILDLGCGEGLHLRMLKNIGAEKAVGVDISEEMIHRAKAVEEENPLGCTFQLGDLRKLGNIGEFDLIACVCVFPYAETVQELKDICRTASLNLKKGGKFVSISYNCHVKPDWSHNLTKYGVKIVPKAENDEGRRTMAVRVVSPDGKIFTVNNYWYPLEVMDAAFRSAGFSSYSFEPPVLDPKVVAESPAGFWDDYLSNPNHTIYVAYK